MSENRIFVGLFIHSNSRTDFCIINGYAWVKNGKITKIGTTEEYNNLEKSGLFTEVEILKLSPSQLIIPGFIDCHVHAPQFPNIGLGLDLPLLEWLDKYTFPLEKIYSDVAFAAKVYDQVVQRLLTNGTTTACYFGSLHLESTLELVKSAIKHHQRALVGKVSMNLMNDAGYYNTVEKELADTTSFVQKVLEFENNLVQPMITPRGAVSCDEQLMTGLANISNEYGCRIQSHLCENLKEIDYVLHINPTCKSFAEVYDKSLLLNDRCIMAHVVHMTDEETALLASRGTSIAHCPASNTRLKSGLCPVRKLLDSNITVGLGTDVSGGDSSSILDALRRTMDVSMHLELKGADGYSIDWKEAFFLATLGGAKALRLEDKIGSFEEGKEFDALIIDVYAKNGPIDKYDFEIEQNIEEYASSLLQRFIYLGDDRNIVQVYVKGQKVVDLMELRSIVDRELTKLEKDVRLLRPSYPRWILLKANSLKLSGRLILSTTLFNQALEEARKINNRLEESLARAAISNSMFWVQSTRSGTFVNWRDGAEHARTSWHQLMYRITTTREE